MATETETKTSRRRPPRPAGAEEAKAESQPIPESDPPEGVEDTDEERLEEHLETYMPPPGTLVHRRGCPNEPDRRRIESHFATTPFGVRLQIRRCLNCGEQVELPVDEKGKPLPEE